MTVELAQASVDVIGAYFVIGAAFAFVFLSFGLRRLDPDRRVGSVRFKLLIAPGIVVLWPVMIVLWAAGAESNDETLATALPREHLARDRGRHVGGAAIAVVVASIRRYPQACRHADGARIQDGAVEPVQEALRRCAACRHHDYLSVFVAVTHFAFAPDQAMTLIQVLIRAFGSCAFGLLTLILAIGPLARLSPRFLPLLYNRRHLGVACFLLALVHAALAIVWYQGFSRRQSVHRTIDLQPALHLDRRISVRVAGRCRARDSLRDGGDQPRFLEHESGPAVLEDAAHGRLAAYVLLVAHVALGVIQSEKSPVYVPCWRLRRRRRGPAHR